MSFPVAENNLVQPNIHTMYFFFFQIYNLFVQSCFSFCGLCRVFLFSIVGCIHLEVGFYVWLNNTSFRYFVGELFYIIPQSISYVKTDVSTNNQNTIFIILHCPTLIFWLPVRSHLTTFIKYHRALQSTFCKKLV